MGSPRARPAGPWTLKPQAEREQEAPIGLVSRSYRVGQMTVAEAMATVALEQALRLSERTWGACQRPRRTSKHPPMKAKTSTITPAVIPAKKAGS